MASSIALDWRGTNVDVTTIERQLSHLWVQLGHKLSDQLPVRTSIFNLVVFTASEDSARDICDRLDQLPRRQPSRVIILASDRSPHEPSVDGAVSVVCQTPAGRRWTRCYERLIVTARGRAAAHPGSVVIPLLIPEIPTYLWWPGQPLFGHGMFHRLLSVAEQLVVDSAQFQSPGDGLADLARVCSGAQGVHDFHWARLTPWREIIAQFFDGPEWLPYAHGIQSLEMKFGSGGNAASATAGALLLVGWLASHLGWKAETPLDRVPARDVTMGVFQKERLIPISLAFKDLGAKAAGRLMGLEMVSQPPSLPVAQFAVNRSEDMERARVTVEIHEGAKINRVVPLDLKGDVELLADELELAGHDKLYALVVGMASRMAGREVWVPA